MGKTRLAVIGGFLGSGKTTSILNLAKLLVNQGKKVGIVTNDQGSDLVDTNFLIQSGLPVLEVTGGCFCCNFEEFTGKVNRLSEDLMPDIVLAEPVGSCTDLIATIYKPMQQKFTKEFCLSPLSVIADPKRVKKLMIENVSSPFPSEINYLFKKQLEEADIVILNKIDTISQEEISSITSFLKERFKGADVIAVSARNEIGMEKWLGLIEGCTFSDKPPLEIDYDTYGRAEEYLGWLNCSALVKSPAPHDGNDFIYDLIESIREKLKDRNMEIAHLKIYEVSEGDFAKASLTGLLDEMDFNKKMDYKIDAASIIINARINSSPEDLEVIVMEAFKEVCSKHNIKAHDIHVQCFKPSRPNPTYRMA